MPEYRIYLGFIAPPKSGPGSGGFVGPKPLVVKVVSDLGEGGSWDPERIIVAMEARSHPDQMGKLFDDLGQIARNRYRANFRQGGDPKWTPLKATTIQGKLRFLRSNPKKTKRAQRLFLRPHQRTPEALAHAPLVKTGALATSYTEKGARGHVEQVATEGQKPTLVVGSAYTITQSKKGRRARAKTKPGLRVHEMRAKSVGKSGGGRTVNLAVIHDQGAPKAHIPARPQFAGGVVKPEDLKEVTRVALRYITGD
jgi:hypothetical protein